MNIFPFWFAWWPITRCMECGRRFWRHWPWCIFEEFCCRRCCDSHMAHVDAEYVARGHRSDRVFRCQEPGCRSMGHACTHGLDDGGDPSYFCPHHAARNGYCCCCGQFCAGIETFDFIHPGYCDNCWDEIKSDEGALDEHHDDFSEQWP